MSNLEFSQLLGNYGEFVGAIAIVVTLIYLAVQIRQNTQQMRRVEMNAGMAQFSVPRMAIASDRGLAELLVKTASATAELDAVDQLRLDMLRSEWMWAFFHNWDRARDGSVDREDWETSTRPGLARLLAGENGARWWDANRQEFNTGFQAEVDRALQDIS